MSKQNKTESTRSYRTQNTLTLTLTLTGDEYRALTDVAKAMNRVSWCGTDNTAASVYKEFVLPELDKTELMANIVSCIATGEDGFDVPEPLHSLRLSELKAAFHAV